MPIGIGSGNEYQPADFESLYRQVAAANGNNALPVNSQGIPIGKMNADATYAQDMSTTDTIAHTFGDISRAMSNPFNDMAEAARNDGHEAGAFVANALGGLTGAFTAIPGSIEEGYEALTGRPVSEAENGVLPGYRMTNSERVGSGINAFIDGPMAAVGGSGTFLRGGANLAKGMNGATRVAGLTEGRGVAGMLAAESAEKGLLSKAGVNKEVASITGSILSDTAEEGGEEFVQSIASDMRNDMLGKKDSEGKDTWGRAVDAGIQGAAAGALLSGAGNAMGYFGRNRIARNSAPSVNNTQQLTAADIDSAFDTSAVQFTDSMKTNYTRAASDAYERSVEPDKLPVSGSGVAIADSSVRLDQFSLGHNTFKATWDAMSPDERQLTVNKTFPGSTVDQVDNLLAQGNITQLNSIIDANPNKNLFNYSLARNPATTETTRLAYNFKGFHQGTGVKVNQLAAQLQGGDLDGDIKQWAMQTSDKPDQKFRYSSPVAAFVSHLNEDNTDFNYDFFPQYASKGKVKDDARKSVEATAASLKNLGINVSKKDIDLIMDLFISQGVNAGKITLDAKRYGIDGAFEFNGKNTIGKAFNYLRTKYIKAGASQADVDTAISMLIESAQSHMGEAAWEERMEEIGNDIRVHEAEHAKALEQVNRGQDLERARTYTGTADRHQSTVTVSENFNIENNASNDEVKGKVTRHGTNIKYQGKNVGQTESALHRNESGESLTKLRNAQLGIIEEGTEFESQCNDLFNSAVRDKLYEELSKEPELYHQDGSIDVDKFISCFVKSYNEYINKYNDAFSNEAYQRYAKINNIDAKTKRMLNASDRVAVCEQLISVMPDAEFSSFYRGFTTKVFTDGFVLTPHTTIEQIVEHESGRHTYESLFPSNSGLDGFLSDIHDAVANKQQRIEDLARRSLDVMPHHNVDVITSEKYIIDNYDSVYQLAEAFSRYLNDEVLLDGDLNIVTVEGLLKATATFEIAGKTTKIPVGLVAFCGDSAMRSSFIVSLNTYTKYKSVLDAYYEGDIQTAINEAHSIDHESEIGKYILNSLNPNSSQNSDDGRNHGIEFLEALCNPDLTFAQKEQFLDIANIGTRSLGGSSKHEGLLTWSMGGGDVIAEGNSISQRIKKSKNASVKSNQLSRSVLEAEVNEFFDYVDQNGNLDSRFETIKKVIDLGQFAWQNSIIATQAADSVYFVNKMAEKGTVTDNQDMYSTFLHELKYGGEMPASQLWMDAADNHYEATDFVNNKKALIDMLFNGEKFTIEQNGHMRIEDSRTFLESMLDSDSVDQFVSVDGDKVTLNYAGFRALLKAYPKMITLFAPTKITTTKKGNTVSAKVGRAQTLKQALKEYNELPEQDRKIRKEKDEIKRKLLDRSDFIKELTKWMFSYTDIKSADPQARYSAAVKALDDMVDAIYEGVASRNTPGFGLDFSDAMYSNFVEDMANTIGDIVDAHRSHFAKKSSNEVFGANASDVFITLFATDINQEVFDNGVAQYKKDQGIAGLSKNDIDAQLNADRLNGGNPTRLFNGQSLSFHLAAINKMESDWNAMRNNLSQISEPLAKIYYIAYMQESDQALKRAVDRWINDGGYMFQMLRNALGVNGISANSTQIVDTFEKRFNVEVIRYIDVFKNNTSTDKYNQGYNVDLADNFDATIKKVSDILDKYAANDLDIERDSLIKEFKNIKDNWTPGGDNRELIKKLEMLRARVNSIIMQDAIREFDGVAGVGLSHLPLISQTETRHFLESLIYDEELTASYQSTESPIGKFSEIKWSDRDVSNAATIAAQSSIVSSIRSTISMNGAEALSMQGLLCLPRNIDQDCGREDRVLTVDQIKRERAADPNKYNGVIIEFDDNQFKRQRRNITSATNKHVFENWFNGLKDTDNVIVHDGHCLCGGFCQNHAPGSKSKGVGAYHHTIGAINKLLITNQETLALKKKKVADPKAIAAMDLALFKIQHYGKINGRDHIDHIDKTASYDEAIQWYDDWVDMLANAYYASFKNNYIDGEVTLDDAQIYSQFSNMSVIVRFESSNGSMIERSYAVAEILKDENSYRAFMNTPIEVEDSNGNKESYSPVSIRDNAISFRFVNKKIELALVEKDLNKLSESEINQLAYDALTTWDGYYSSAKGIDWKEAMIMQNGRKLGGIDLTEPNSVLSPKIKFMDSVAGRDRRKATFAHTVNKPNHFYLSMEDSNKAVNATKSFLDEVNKGNFGSNNNESNIQGSIVTKIYHASNKVVDGRLSNIFKVVENNPSGSNASAASDGTSKTMAVIDVQSKNDADRWFAENMDEVTSYDKLLIREECVPDRFKDTSIFGQFTKIRYPFNNNYYVVIDAPAAIDLYSFDWNNDPYDMVDVVARGLEDYIAVMVDNTGVLISSDGQAFADDTFFDARSKKRHYFYTEDLSKYRKNKNTRLEYVSKDEQIDPDKIIYPEVEGLDKNVIKERVDSFVSSTLKTTNGATHAVNALNGGQVMGMVKQEGIDGSYWYIPVILPPNGETSADVIGFEIIGNKVKAAIRIDAKADPYIKSTANNFGDKFEAIPAPDYLKADLEVSFDDYLKGGKLIVNRETINGKMSGMKTIRAKNSLWVATRIFPGSIRHDLNHDRVNGEYQVNPYLTDEFSIVGNNGMRLIDSFIDGGLDAITLRALANGEKVMFKPVNISDNAEVKWINLCNKAMAKICRSIVESSGSITPKVIFEPWDFAGNDVTFTGSDTQSQNTVFSTLQLREAAAIVSMMNPNACAKPGYTPKGEMLDGNGKICKKTSNGKDIYIEGYLSPRSIWENSSGNITQSYEAAIGLQAYSQDAIRNGLTPFNRKAIIDSLAVKYHAPEMYAEAVKQTAKEKADDIDFDDIYDRTYDINNMEFDSVRLREVYEKQVDAQARNYQGIRWAYIDQDGNRHAGISSFHDSSFNQYVQELSSAFGCSINTDIAAYLIQAGYGWTMNEKQGIQEIHEKDVRAVVNGIITDLKDPNKKFFMNSNGYVEGRIGIPALPYHIVKDLYDRSPIFHADRRWQDFSDVWSAINSELDRFDTKCEQLVTFGSFKEQTKNRARRDALLLHSDYIRKSYSGTNFCQEWKPNRVFVSLTIQEMRRTVNDGVNSMLSMYQVVKDENGNEVVQDVKKLCEEMANEAAEQTKKASEELSARGRNEWSSPDYGMIAQEKDLSSERHGKVLRTTENAIKLFKLATPMIAPANIVDTAWRTKLAELGIDMHMGQYAFYKNDIVKNETARMVADNPQFKVMFDAIQEAVIIGDYDTFALGLTNAEDKFEYLEEYGNRMKSNKFDEFTNRYITFVSGQKFFSKSAINIWVKNFATLCQENEVVEMTRKQPGTDMSVLEWGLLNDPVGLLESVMQSNSPSRIYALQAMNMAMRGAMAQDNIATYYMQRLMKMYPKLSLLNTAFGSTFYRYTINSGARVLNTIMPLSTMHYLLVNKMAGDHAELQRLQLQPNLRAAVAADAVRFATPVLAMLIVALAAMEPPEDPDKYGDYREWTFFGLRIAEEWWIKDVLNMALPLACFEYSCMQGTPRLDIIVNGAADIAAQNPLMNIDDLVEMFADPESYIERVNAQAENYTSYPGGEPTTFEQIETMAEVGLINSVTKLMLPSFVRSLYRDSQVYEHSYKRVWAEGVTDATLNNGTTQPDTEKVSYHEAMYRKAARNNPMLGMILDILNPSEKTSYLATGNPILSYKLATPNVEYHDPYLYASMTKYNVQYQDENGKWVDKSPEEQAAVIGTIIATLESEEDMSKLRAQGFAISRNTQYACGVALRELVESKRNALYEWYNSASSDPYVLGDGDYWTGREIRQQIYEQANNEIEYYTDLYYNKLYSQEMKQGVTTYYRHNTTYRQDNNGNYYASGFRPDGTISLSPFQIARGTTTNPEGTMGWEGDWATESNVVEGASTFERALEPVASANYETPNINEIGDDEKKSNNKNSKNKNVNNNSSGSSGGSSGGSRGGSRGGGSRGGGGGGGGTSSIYSRLPNTSNVSPKTMNTSRAYNPNYDYLRPNFETKGSREAYKRSDI